MLEAHQWTRYHRNGTVYVVPESSRSPLLIAAMNGDLAYVRSIDAADGSIKAYDPSGVTPLCIAAVLGNKVAFETLIEAYSMAKRMISSN